MPVRKATKLVTPSVPVSQALGLKCTGHENRQIKGTWRDLSGRRVDTSAWCGGYTSEFSTNVLKAFEKQLKKEILDCFVTAGMENSLEAQARQAELQQESLDDLRARRRAMLDDMPMSVREEFARRRRAVLMDDVPLSIRRNLENKTVTEKEDQMKHRRNLMDDVPLSIRRNLEQRKA